MWIFGYGSIIWKPGFDWAERREGYVRGWKRRFWQGSIDHRGVPGAPGRGVTLLPEPGEACWGVAYRIARARIDEVLVELDHREKGGYERHHVEVHGPGGEVVVPEALVYVATEENPDYLGPAPIPQIARQVLGSRGPSGPNPEYVLELAEALRAFGAEDPHVFELEAWVRRLQQTSEDDPEDDEEAR